MSRKFCIYLFELTIAVVFMAACSSSPAPEPTPTPDSAEAKMAVIKMYKAISDGDNDAYMDTILPTNRKVVNPTTLLQAMSIGGGIGGFSIGLDFGELSKMLIRDLKVEPVRVDANYTLLRARGIVRYPNLMLELPFCDMHDVRLDAGRWYVDIYAPERGPRLERVIANRQAQLISGANNLPTPAAGMELDSLFSGLGMGLEMALDLCE